MTSNYSSRRGTALFTRIAFFLLVVAVVGLMVPTTATAQTAAGTSIGNQASAQTARRFHEQRHRTLSLQLCNRLPA